MSKPELKSSARGNFDFTSCGISTKAIHVGQHEIGLHCFPVPPIVTNSAMLFDSFEEGRSMLSGECGQNTAYQRCANPTVAILEDKFRHLENCQHCLAVNSGMTASMLIFRSMLKMGDHVILQRGIFYETIEQLQYFSVRSGIDVSITSGWAIENFSSAKKNNTRMVFIETPANPSFADVDIRELADWCSQHQIILVVDNTLMTPLGQNPLALGAAITLHSLTKHINGHGDVLGGMISTNHREIYERMKEGRENSGLGLDPFSAWLTIRGMRTLPLRLQRHASNAKSITKMLDRDFPELEWRSVWRTPNSVSNDVAPRLNTGLMAIVFSSREIAMDFVKNLRIIRLGPTFGNVESLCYHYGGFSDPDDESLQILNIPGGLVRLSVGLEDADDLINDIRNSIHLASRS